MKEVIGDAVLYCGDSEELLPGLGPFDALVTDPPYGINEHHKKVASRRKLAKPRDYGAFDWDKSTPSKELIDSIRKTSKYQVIFGGNFFELPPTKCYLIWDKKNGDNDFADCELAWTNLNKAVRLKRHLWNGMIREGNELRYHPTQKPLEVMEWCIGHLPKDVETIFDPFMGSGTTGVAAVRKGKKFTGIEREIKYFDAACRRIEKSERQPIQETLI